MSTEFDGFNIGDRVEIEKGVAFIEELYMLAGEPCATVQMNSSDERFITMVKGMTRCDD
jgi:hypothetical protein